MSKRAGAEENISRLLPEGLRTRAGSYKKSCSSALGQKP